jgi:hypothetical protein
VKICCKHAWLIGYIAFVLTAIWLTLLVRLALER